MIKADLHNHLGSHGANPGFDETIDLVHDKLGSNSAFAIANSDDYRFERFVEQKRGKYHREYIDKRAVYVPEKNILVIKEQEMFTKEGHILAIATPYGKNVETKNAKDAIKAAKDLGALLDAVHPFYSHGAGAFLQYNPSLLELFSTWEIYNGSAEFSFPFLLPPGANQTSLDFYTMWEMGKLDTDPGMSSSTDGHNVESVGKCYTLLRTKIESLMSNFVPELDRALRSVKSLDNLHMRPNKGEAAIHALKMALVKVRLRSD